ncbi:MAG: hypothetical protein JWP42_3537 [Pseudomonas sp.]|nr:hypothetical protein [Pseudomonas sp.]
MSGMVRKYHLVYMMVFPQKQQRCHDRKQVLENMNQTCLGNVHHQFCTGLCTILALACTFLDYGALFIDVISV